jgi:hypothetical protein
MRQWLPTVNAIPIHAAQTAKRMGLSIDTSRTLVGSIAGPSTFARSTAVHRPNHLLPTDQRSIHGL